MRVYSKWLSGLKLQKSVSEIYSCFDTRSNELFGHEYTTLELAIRMATILFWTTLTFQLTLDWFLLCFNNNSTLGNSLQIFVVKSECAVAHLYSCSKWRRVMFVPEEVQRMSCLEQVKLSIWKGLLLPLTFAGIIEIEHLVSILIALNCSVLLLIIVNA